MCPDVLPVSRVRLTAANVRAFTLVEALAVVTIAAVLAAIGFVGIRAAVASAKTASCMANLRQIGTALTLYAHDHDDRYPPTTFQGVLAFRGAGAIPARPKEFKAALAAYGVADDQFYCPMDSHARTAYQGEHYAHVDTSYYMSIDYYAHGRVEGAGYVFMPSTLADPSRVNVFDDDSDLTIDADGRRVRTGPHGSRYDVLRADGAVVNIPIVQP